MFAKLDMAFDSSGKKTKEREKEQERRRSRESLYGADKSTNEYGMQLLNWMISTVIADGVCYQICGSREIIIEMTIAY